MKGLRVAVALCAGAALACQVKEPAVASNQAVERESDAVGDRVDAIIAQVMSRMHVPGMAVVVVHDGAVVKQTAYGVASLELGTPVTDATRFQIASATKVLTATLVMQLVQEGVLSLEAPVHQYLPDAPPAWESITIAQLAAHASGIPDGGILERPDSSTVEDVTASLAKQPLDFAPGTQALRAVRSRGADARDRAGDRQAL